MMELPTIAKTNYGSTSSALSFGGPDPELVRWAEDALAQSARRAQAHASLVLGAINQPKEKPMPASRIVRVFIADPNESIPIDKRVLHASGEMHTDLTDQELFFEANPAALLAKHNEYRVTVLDKKLTNPQREIKLEPARIRDLKMVVVDVAVF
jgi:hypothetical protein